MQREKIWKPLKKESYIVYKTIQVNSDYSIRIFL